MILAAREYSDLTLQCEILSDMSDIFVQILDCIYSLVVKLQYLK